MRTNALELRQRLGAVLSRLDKYQQPIIVEKQRQARAVLIPMSLYHERFVDFEAAEQRRALYEELTRESPATERPTLGVLRKLRYGS